VYVEKTIRQQVIEAIQERLYDITILNGYNHTLTTTGLGRVAFSEEDSPALSIRPGIEEVTKIASCRSNAMTVIIDGLLTFDPETENPSTKIEPFLGDIIHCMLGPIFTLHFTNGSLRIQQGDLITGETTSATSHVLNVRVTSGAWNLSNAAGTIKIRDMRRVFRNGENILLSASYSLKLSSSPIIQDRFKDLVDNVSYVSGGIEAYPVIGETVVLCTTSFIVAYPTVNDNPYLTSLT